MSARSIASATVSFGLVSIPVKLYATGQPSGDISFHLLHDKCGTRLKQQYICPTDEEIVPRENMVKGYEFAKGRYVTFKPEELKALEEVGNQTIEITEFVPLSEVDPVYFEKAYYLGTDKGGEKAYRLLSEAMRETGRSALATYAARGKQYLVLIRPAEEGLVMQQLRYADEVRAFSEVPIGDATVKEAELRLAVQFVEQLAADTFDPAQYKDTVKERVEALIQEKVDEGKEIAAPEAAEAPRGAQIIDLMEALKASLAARGDGGEPKARAKQDGEEEEKPHKARKGPKRSSRAPKSERRAAK